MYSLWERIKSGIAEFVQSRIFVLIIVFCITSAILVQRIFYLQIVKGQEYLDDYKLQIQKTKEIQGTRGNIYDRNGNLLAYNELAYSVTIEDNGSYDSIAQQNKVLNKTISSVIKMVESNGDTVINNFGIILDSNTIISLLRKMRLRNYVLLPMYMENQPSTSFLKNRKQQRQMNLFIISVRINKNSELMKRRWTSPLY